MSDRYETHRLEWCGIVVEVRYCRNWLDCYERTYGYPLAHLTITAIDPPRAPLPVTDTGFLSHFTRPDSVEAAGGPAAFVRTALDDAARDPAWLDREAASRQLSLL